MKIFSPNFTAIPNPILDKQSEFSLIELAIIIFVSRQTFGWHRKEAELSISFVMKGTGICKQSVVNGVERLIKRGILSKRQGRNRITYLSLVVYPVDNQTPQVVYGVDNQVVYPVDTNKETSKQTKLERKEEEEVAKRRPFTVEQLNGRRDRGEAG